MAGSKRDKLFYVVAYDIPDDRRRAKAHKILSGFGQWAQYSLFECFLTSKERVLLCDKLDAMLKPAEDSVRFYPLCTGCLDKVKTVGGPKPEEPIAFVV